MTLTTNTDTERKKRKNQIESSAKLFRHFYNHTTITYKNILNFKLPDSRFRYMIFCLSLFLKSCEVIIESSDLLLKEYVDFLVNLKMAEENKDDYFVNNLSNNEVMEIGLNYLKKFMKEWIEYSNAFKTNDTDKTATIICSMILFAESQEHINESKEHINRNDLKRTRKLIFDIEQSVPRMRDTFLDMMKIRGGFLY